MRFAKTAATLILAAGAGLGGAAHADTIFTVTAEYDPYILGNTTFTVNNLSGTTLTNVDIISGSETKVLSNIGAGQSVTYAFDDQETGNFLQNPGYKYESDQTLFQVSAGYAGTTASTAEFSAVSNLTGQYVDFLGACWNARPGCSVDPNGAYDLSDVVAQGVQPVPLPPALALFASGLLGLAARLRRRP
jgi:hypothetical protein